MKLFGKISIVTILAFSTISMFFSHSASASGACYPKSECYDDGGDEEEDVEEIVYSADDFKEAIPSPISYPLTDEKWQDYGIDLIVTKVRPIIGGAAFAIRAAINGEIEQREDLLIEAYYQEKDIVIEYTNQTSRPYFNVQNVYLR